MKKSNPLALIPIGVFIAFYLTLGIVFEYVMKIPMGFYSVPVIVAFLLALFVAVLQTKGEKLEKKFEIMGQGIGDKNIITMLLIFMLAGIFVGGRGIGNVAIEDFVDGAGEQFGKLFAVAAIGCDFNLVNGDVGLEFRIRCLADKEERWRYAVVFVLQKVGIVECLEYVGITGSVGVK